MVRILSLVVLYVLTGVNAFGAYADVAAAREAALDGVRMTQAERESALKLLKAEAERTPKDAETLHALVLMCEANNDWDTGLPTARELVKLAPEVADHQYLLGNALFSTINEVSMFNKGARASAGRKAYEKALKLDPLHVGARSGLFYFYLEAPGFAGGSKKKAVEIAEGMSKEPKNARTGYELLAAVAVKNEDWDEYNRILPKLLDESTSSEERANVLLTACYTTLFTRKDYGEGLELAAQYREAAGEGRGGHTTNYFEGVALHGLERYEEAVEKFAAVLSVQPNAKNTRWLIAESCEKLGRDAEAAGHYAEFAERFPKDDNAKKAKKKVKKLG